MLREMLRSKIHRVRVTEVNLNYAGSITIDRRLLEAASILPYEKVQVVNINNGSRFETYVMEGEREGEICVNGAAARLAQPGDLLIIMAYGFFTDEELTEHHPRIVLVDEHNGIAEVHGSR